MTVCKMLIHVYKVISRYQTSLFIFIKKKTKKKKKTYIFTPHKNCLGKAVLTRGQNVWVFLSRKVILELNSINPPCKELSSSSIPRILSLSDSLL